MLDDRSPCIFTPWLTLGMSMWPQSAGACHSWTGVMQMFAVWWCRSLLLAGAGLQMSAAWWCRSRCCWVKLELVCCCCCCCCCCCSVVCKCGWLLRRRFVVSAMGKLWGDQRWSSKDFWHSSKKLSRCWVCGCLADGRDADLMLAGDC